MTRICQCISVEITERNGMAEIRYFDDGRGLNVSKIEGKAREKGILKPTDAYSTEEICQIIFLPQFSTKVKVTDVSGRGVGMDAVKNFLENFGGRIDMKLGKTCQGYVPVEFLIKLPSKLYELKQNKFENHLRRAT
ncbi:MAG: ATP-binding protein [Pseudobdellovibrionaceae bacterium]|nr:ATP-binding protein [Pseudobdellovibrionaceae bacterium]